MTRTVFEELLRIPNGFDNGKRSDFGSNDRIGTETEYLCQLICDDLLADAGPAALPDQFDWSRFDNEVCATKPVEFVYDWEREFSEGLDAHKILWRYKPRTFAVEWDQDGNFVDSFTPDFYLAEHNLYVVLAPWGYGDFGMNVRKVRMLRGLYASIRIEVIAGRDYGNVAEWLSEPRLRRNRSTANREEWRTK